MGIRGIVQVKREEDAGLRTRVDKSGDPPLSNCMGVHDACSNPGRWVRQNSAYIDDEKNWGFYCEECEKMNDAYWDDMWSNVDYF